MSLQKRIRKNMERTLATEAAAKAAAARAERKKAFEEARLKRLSQRLFSLRASVPEILSAATQVQR